jgi:hypothetical protein
MSTSDLFKPDPKQTARRFYRPSLTSETADARAVATMETSIGTLAFRNGIPTQLTANKLYDNLDLLHGVDAFVKGFSAVALYRLREAQRRATSLRPEPLHIFFKGTSPRPRPMAPKAVRFDAWCYIDLKNYGPTIVDFPPTTVGIVDDMWSRFVGDLGPAGPDGGRGGQYLLLPPCYDGPIPQGYTILKSRTTGVWVYIRRPSARSTSNAPKLVAERLKVYSLTPIDTARPVEVVDGSRLIIREIVPEDYEFYEHLHQLVQTEPASSLDRGLKTLFASIGIVKGTPFRPNLHMKEILADAAAIGCATIRALNHCTPDLRLARYREAANDPLICHLDSHAARIRTMRRRIIRNHTDRPSRIM